MHNKKHGKFILVAHQNMLNSSQCLLINSSHNIVYKFMIHNLTYIYIYIILGGCGGLGQLSAALAELWEVLGELWEGLYIQKLPINRPSGRYVNIGDTTNKNIPVYSQSVDTVY